MMIIDKIALSILLIGGINWGSVGIFNFDIVGWIFGGTDSVGARIIFVIVGLCALWCISLLFRDTALIGESSERSESRIN